MNEDTEHLLNLVDKVQKLRIEKSDLEYAMKIINGEVEYRYDAVVALGRRHRRQQKKYYIEIPLHSARPFFRARLADVNDMLSALEPALEKADTLAAGALQNQ